MEFGVLGPLEVRSTDGPIDLTGPKRRALLALLLLHAGHAVSVDDISDALWGGEPPRTAATTLQTFVYQLRKRFGIDAVQTTATGYVLEIADGALDSRRFEQLVRAAMAARDPAGAARLLTGALELWRGPAFGELATEPWCLPGATRLDQLRVQAVEAWAAAMVGARDTAGVSAELEKWTHVHPLREPLWTLRLAALATEGRGAEALRVATDARARLRDELGVDPGAAFTAVENAILREEPLPSWRSLGGFPPEPPSPNDTRSAPATMGPARSRVRRRPPAAARPMHLAPTRFVGRAVELALVRDAIDGARKGLPQVALVIGDAGVGKSRLVSEALEYARVQDCQVLIGACHDDSAAPYLPIATALGMDPAIRSDLFAAPPVADDNARLRLFLQVTDALIVASLAKPTVLVLEDVHWGDDATIALLRHLFGVVLDAAAQRHPQLTLVLTSRPTPTNAAATALLARLDRDHRTKVLTLEGLTDDECRDLAAEILGHRPSQRVGDALRSATDGNPLLLGAALERLRTESVNTRSGTLPELLAATDLDQEMWLCINRVDDATLEVLVDAAVCATDTVDDLAIVSGLDEGTLYDHLDEASEHDVLHVDGDRYRFAHPQMRQILYHSTRGTERARRHLRIAERLGEHAHVDIAVVAHHLEHAGDLAEPARVRDTCGAAADAAERVGAWGHAARHAAAALAAAHRTGADGAALGALELRFGRAAWLGGESADGLAALHRAIERGREADDLAVWGEAVIRVAREASAATDLAASTRDAIAELDAFLAAAGEREPALRSRAHALIAELAFNARDTETARVHASEARQLAARLHDDDVDARVRFAEAMQLMNDVQLEAARDGFDATRQIGARLTDPHPRLWCVGRLALLAVTTGALDRAEVLLDESLDGCRAADNVGERAFVAALAATVACVRGRFATVEAQAAASQQAYRVAPYWFAPIHAFPALAIARAHAGDRAGADTALDTWDTAQPRASRRIRPLVAALTGDLAFARAAAIDPPFRPLEAPAAPDFHLLGPLSMQIDLAALGNAPDLLRNALDTLALAYERGARVVPTYPTLVARVIARGTAITGRDDDARKWFDTALADAERAGALAEAARTALEHASFEHERGRSGRTDDLMAIARRHYETLGFEPRLIGSELLGPSLHSRAVRPTATRIVLVTDLSGSTTLNNDLGDARYLTLLDEHDGIIRHRLRELDGVEFKHTGDGIAAWFLSVDAALRCAHAILHDFAMRRANGATPLDVRIAMSAGEPTIVDGDLLGLAVTLAFRALGVAPSGSVTATSEVVALARGLAWVFTPHQRARLRGFPEPIELFTAVPG